MFRFFEILEIYYFIILFLFVERKRTLKEKEKFSIKIKQKTNTVPNNSYSRYLARKAQIEKFEGSLFDFSGAYHKFGMNKTPSGIEYREWCPGARGVFLFGEFSKIFEME